MPILSVERITTNQRYFIPFSLFLDDKQKRTAFSNSANLPPTSIKPRALKQKKFFSGSKTCARFFSRNHLRSRRNATVQSPAANVSPGCCSWNRSARNCRETRASRLAGMVRARTSRQQESRSTRAKLPAAKEALAVYESVNWPG